MGSTWIERHVTLDRNMEGSDHACSVTPHGLFKLVSGIRDLEKLKSACRTSEKITVDDRTRPRIIDNLCTGEELTEESTNQIRRQEKRFGKCHTIGLLRENTPRQLQ